MKGVEEKRGVFREREKVNCDSRDQINGGRGWPRKDNTFGKLRHISMDSMKGQGGIQMLLTAEQEARQIISSAKNCKTPILTYLFPKLQIPENVRLESDFRVEEQISIGTLSSVMYLDHLVFGSYLKLNFEEFRFCSATLNRTPCTKETASSQNSQANDDVPPVEGLPPVSAEGIYRYLGTLAGLVERQARAVGTNVQDSLHLLGVAL
ncbi:hypothetical protein CK203_087312 [Vitis vinifera]|uniref:Uncharacterized protein n=1 Tax=Vitis vinifera TaxID=29760 RepID=A0A438BME0_VITVI|nr:hypothetical protein CK203_087312 [Vitis vinifera]